MYFKYFFVFKFSNVAMINNNDIPMIWLIGMFTLPHGPVFKKNIGTMQEIKITTSKNKYLGIVFSLKLFKLSNINVIISIYKKYFYIEMNL